MLYTFFICWQALACLTQARQDAKQSPPYLRRDCFAPCLASPQAQAATGLAMTRFAYFADSLIR
jgi:hypothetical protein